MFRFIEGAAKHELFSSFCSLLCFNIMDDLDLDFILI